MIIDSLQQASRYDALHPLFPLACATLLGEHLASLAPGRHDVRGGDLTLLVNREEGKGREGAVLEAHRRFIDIQLVLDGRDEIGWRPLADCRSVVTPYDAERDVAFYGDSPLLWSALSGNLFAIFFPWDAHAPLGGTGRLSKAVMKIRI